MKIFAERELREFFDSRLEGIRQDVQNKDQNALLNVNETQYIDYLVNRCTVEPLVLDFAKENLRVSQREERIPAEYFPRDFHVVPGKSYNKFVITYRIPYSGEKMLLKCTPSTRLFWTEEMEVEDGFICFDIINWRDNSEEITRKAEDILGNIHEQYKTVCTEVDGFNRNLESQVRQTVQSRKAQLLKQLNLLSSLGVPVYKTENVPETFAVPIIKKKVIIQPPDVPNASYTPEPALDNETYVNILQIIHDMGVEMERHPGVYEGKHEEILRDFFIILLSPHFHSVTGETFNAAGKTDILIRHEKINVFVAEFKFWHGKEEFHKDIDQTLGYLTWRDSKAALICFVKNKELNPVLEQIEGETQKHSCFVKYNGKQKESWYNFEFHLKDDPTRSVRLAVLCFHFSGR